MFSVLFPGQGSQSIGMIKDFYDNFEYVKNLFDEANDAINVSLSKLIFDGPKTSLDETENTQPAIFLVSYAIYEVIRNETQIDLNKADFFAGHSLGEYSALACSKVINFNQTIKLLKIRGRSMQNAVPKNEGGMVAVLGEDIEKIREIIDINQDNFKCYIGNDNSNGQSVISGRMSDLDKLVAELKSLNIKNIKLPVSAPFHCILMSPATEIMRKEISNIDFSIPTNNIVSNVTAKPSKDPEKIKNLLIDQIEKPVRWRESVINMINAGSQKFVEIGPGKVLSGLVKRIDRNVKLIQVNNISDLKNL
ncbi:ACP S-malonyltransferase [Pelagibacteraceae bacterium GOM-A3]|nr:ACP S-malonyltransferase [Pelagibacteraceae bacterium GOM-A3]